MRTRLVGIVIALALTALSVEAAAQCPPQPAPGNYNAYMAGLDDYYCYYYGGYYCTEAQAYAAAASVPVYAPTGPQCANAGIYNYLCRYYEYYGYGWDYYGYCTIAASEASTYSCCPTPPSTGPEVLESIYFTRDWVTGDTGVGLCPNPRSDWYGASRYTQPAYKVDLYLNLPAGHYGTRVYNCQRGGPQGQTDEYLDTSPSCSGGWQSGGWPNMYLANSAIDGAHSVPLYLCQATVYNQYGMAWTEYRVDPNGCSGATQIKLLGYAHSESAFDAASVQDAYELCVQSAGCFGECGADCGGIIGTHISTGACLSHDECVCRHGGNIWAIECWPGFVAAAVSWAVTAIVNLVSTVIDWIVDGIKAIARFLCFWC